MNLQRRLVCASLCTLPLAAHANGAAFFYSDGDSEKEGPDALVYFGNIKDTQGHYIDKVQVYVLLLDYGVTIPVKKIRQSHYRTPDIHAAAKALGATLNPERIQIAIIHRDFQLARPVAIPKRMTGIYSADIVLKPR